MAHPVLYRPFLELPMPLFRLPAALLALALALPLAAAEPAAAPAPEDMAAAQAQQPGRYVGRILMRSKKAKTISIEVGKGAKAEAFTFRHLDPLPGIEHANAELFAILTTEIRDGEQVVIEAKPKLAAIPAGVRDLDTAAIAGLLAARKPGLLLIDSRPRSRWLQSHLPGSISLPEDVLKEKGAANALPADKSAPLIFYCGGYTCGLSTSSAKLAKEAGYSDVAVYQAGEPAWVKAGRATYAETSFITGGNVILIDLRDPAVSAKEAIANAISIPMDKLAQAAEEDLPQRAPLVLYGNDEAQAIAARAVLQKAEFKKVSLVEGGLELWKAGGGTTVTGALPTTATWKRIAVPGEVPFADFQKAVAGPVDGVVLLDVRGPAELAEGKVPGALSIPLDQLTRRIGEVPAGKKLYVFCNSGSRAEMAVKALKKAGHEASFLVADIDCENGKCEFSE